MPVRDKVHVDILTETRQSQTNLKQLVAGFFTAQAAWSAAQKTLQKTVEFMRESIELAKAQEAAETKLAGVLKATGEAAGFNAEELKEMASGLQSVTTYGDEAILSAQSILLTFKGLQGEAFERTQELALDLSATFGQDLKSSAIQLGKALEDPKRGLTSLRRIGVSFTEEQEKMIDSMIEAGNVAGAQAEILDTLERQVGGVAEQMADSSSGSLQQMNNAVGDLKEEIGFLIIEGFEPLAKIVRRNAEINAEYLRSLRELENLFEEVGEGQEFASTERLNEQLEAIDRSIEAIKKKQGKLHFSDIFGGASRINETTKLNALIKAREELVEQLNDAQSETVRQEKEMLALRIASGEHLRDFNEVYNEQFETTEKSAAHQEHVLRVTREVNGVIDSAKTEYEKLNEQLEYFESLADNGWKVGGKLADAIQLLQTRISEMENQWAEKQDYSEVGQKWREDIGYIEEATAQWSAYGDEAEEANRKAKDGIDDTKSAIELAQEAMEKLGESMAEVTGEAYLSAFEQMGEALQQGKSGAEAMTGALEDFVGAIINAMPRLLFYAGVQLLTPATWPIGLGLILMSGIAAIAKGAYNAEMNENGDNGDTNTKQENTTIIYIEGSVVSEAELEHVVTNAQSRNYGAY